MEKLNKQFNDSEAVKNSGKEISQISKNSGISGDYFNEFFGTEQSLKYLDEDELRPLRLYRERYAGANEKYFDNPLLPVLDKLVNEMNNQIKSKTYTKERLKKLINQIKDIIYKGKLPEDIEGAER